jgi:hypothetical protein
MNLRQIYHTTILHPDNNGIVWSLMVVPIRSFAEEGDLWRTIMSIIDPEQIGRINPRMLPFVIASMLNSDEDVLKGATRNWESSASTHRVMEFAEHLAFERVVPVEHSPLVQEALVTIAARADDAGGEQGGVTLVQSGGDKLIVVVGPDGVVIAAANPLASIWEKILKYLQGL